MRSSPRRLFGSLVIRERCCFFIGLVRPLATSSHSHLPRRGARAVSVAAPASAGLGPARLRCRARQRGSRARDDSVAAPASAGLGPAATTAATSLLRPAPGASRLGRRAAATTRGDSRAGRHLRLPATARRCRAGSLPHAAAGAGARAFACAPPCHSWRRAWAAALAACGGCARWPRAGRVVDKACCGMAHGSHPFRHFQIV
jgi:hypothetical protein